MTASSAPFGFIPSREATGYGTRGENKFEGAIPSGYATDIYKYQPVKMTTAGQLQPAVSSADFIGVFMGCEYTGTDGRRRVSNYWPGGTAILSGTTVTSYIMDDPNSVFEVQTDGSLAQSAIGDQADITNGSNQNGSTGLSAATLSSTLKGTGNQGMFRVVNISDRVDNAWGDAYTVVKVTIAQHQYVANKVAF
jgi:hypothetical protein